MGKITGRNEGMEYIYIHTHTHTHTHNVSDILPQTSLVSVV